MTAVYIRDENFAEGAHLCDVPLGDIDSIIPTIKGWGLADESTEDLYGQFVYDAGRGVAYFEIVVGAPSA